MLPWPLSTIWPCVVGAGDLLSPPQLYTESPRAEMDLADASLLWLAADTGVTRIMTMDVRNFSRYRLPDGQAIEIL
jgi:hypothetical protein